MSVNHVPVLSNEIINYLNLKNDGIFVDATVGLGGHSQNILKHFDCIKRLIGIDLDQSALALAENQLYEYKEKINLVQGNFKNLTNILKNLGVNSVDGVLMDLGVSSLQLDTPHRGFSFQKSGDLDMRMDTENGISAADIINDSSPEELISIFEEFGEERYSKRIVREIISTRKLERVTSTLQLARIVENAYPKKSNPRNRNNSRKIHPATRVFQALRITVNKELENLKKGLDDAVSLLNPDGFLCIISFHSLEDRIVKRRFQGLSKSCICPPKIPICICNHKKVLNILTKRPVIPCVEEIENNPRARSAKLRVATKVGLCL
ncbi:16S rRNA (cytosine(1402)-N(4))-methyltransferase RsmH [Candidatus Poribacteria bacterium]|nr:16S rRNA (cytosine(1402)-N(4))-methyltransferase RsmH [Candidatus Poribacteria bacterium]